VKKNPLLDKLAGRINPGLRKFLGNTGWLLADKLIQMGLGLLVGVWVARYLGPDQFGVLSYALAFAGLFSPLAKLGLDKILVRDLARRPLSKEETLGTAAVLKFLSGIGVLLLSVAIISAINPQDNQVRILVGIVAAGTLFQSFETIDFWFQSQVEAKYSVWAKNGAYFLVSLFRIILIQIEAPLLAFAASYLLEQFLMGVGMLIAYRLTGHFIQAWHFSRSRVKELLQDSWAVIISGVVIMIYMRIDQIMLGQMIGSEAVGVYSASVKLSEMWYFIPGAITQSFFPSIIQGKELGKETYDRRMQKLFNLMALLSYGIAIPLTFLSTDIIRLIYGSDYIEGGASLSILVWAGLFVSLGLARGCWIITEGLMKFSAATNAIGAGVNVLLNFLLIPRYGITGAAIATVMAQAIAAYLANSIYPSTRSIFIQQTQALLLFGWLKI
jgi:polysaccharide transporter, PST family